MTAPRSFLFYGPLRGSAEDTSIDWVEDNVAILDDLAAKTRLLPIVLLPDDILAEDYEPRFEVHHGDAACRMLTQLSAIEGSTSPSQSPLPRLIFIDFTPTLFADDKGLLTTLNETLRVGIPEHLKLAVVAPTGAGLHLAGFQQWSSISDAIESSLQTGTWERCQARPANWSV